MKRPSYFFVIIGLLCIVMLSMVSACAPTERQDSVREHVRITKTKPAPPVDAIPSFEALEQFEFPENQSRRSPFKSRQTSAKIDANRPDLERPKQPLESFPLDALKLVGTIEEGARKWALIKTPQNIVQRVTVGDYMGKNYGRVVSVENNALIIEERTLTEGVWEKRMLTFKLSPSSVKGK
jgi:type IV pilus assembly protein PilP